MTLPEYIQSKLDISFAWGTHDCITFTFGWVNIAAGRDVMAVAPTWRSEREAYRVIAEHGGVRAAIDKRLRSINSKMARDGDVAMFEKTVFLFSGEHIVSVGITGLKFVPRKFAECAWSY